VNDKTVAGLTGAQWLMILVFAAGVWIIGWVRPATALDERRENAAADSGTAIPEPTDGEPLEPTP
jgi:hypothetical protein